MSSVEEVEAALSEERAALAGARDERALEEWRTRVLGRSGRLTAILRSLGEQPPERRRELGTAANRAKRALEEALEGRRRELAERSLAALSGGSLDVTLPGRPRPRGGLHPITQTLREILAVFSEMGFASVEGPEVELDRYNFDRLRIPEDHPARDMWDTFWFDEEPSGAGRLLLRTHTSPMQIRHMEQHDPPIRIVVPGRCYRYEATDATHEWMMQQVEVLAVDEGISMADLKGTLWEFARRIFGAERQVLLRNSYFPFVEPGVELRRRLLRLRRHRRRLHRLPRRALARDHGSGDGASRDPGGLGLRHRALHRLRRRHGRRADRDAAPRRGGHPPLLPERPAVPQPVLRPRAGPRGGAGGQHPGERRCSSH